jgi:hypothetical protein
VAQKEYRKISIHISIISSICSLPVSLSLFVAFPYTHKQSRFPRYPTITSDGKTPYKQASGGSVIIYSYNLSRNQEPAIWRSTGVGDARYEGDGERGGEVQEAKGKRLSASDEAKPVY